MGAQIRMTNMGRWWVLIRMTNMGRWWVLNRDDTYMKMVGFNCM